MRPRKKGRCEEKWDGKEKVGRKEGEAKWEKMVNKMNKEGN